MDFKQLCLQGNNFLKIPFVNEDKYLAALALDHLSLKCYTFKYMSTM